MLRCNGRKSQHAVDEGQSLLRTRRAHQRAEDGVVDQGLRRAVPGEIGEKTEGDDAGAGYEGERRGRSPSGGVERSDDCEKQNERFERGRLLDA